MDSNQEKSFKLKEDVDWYMKKTDDRDVKNNTFNHNLKAVRLGSRGGTLLRQTLVNSKKL